LDGDWNVGRDIPVAGVQSNIHRQISRKPERQAAIGAADVPRLAQLRSRSRFYFDPAVAGAQFENIESARHAHETVAGVGVQTTIDILDLKTAIAGREIQIAPRPFARTAPSLVWTLTFALRGMWISSSALWV
jgi:hypothetical protein